MSPWIQVLCFALVGMGCVCMGYTLLCGLRLSRASKAVGWWASRPQLLGVLRLMALGAALLTHHLARGRVYIDDLVVSVVFFLCPLLGLLFVSSYRRMADTPREREWGAKQAFLNALSAKDDYTLRHSVHVSLLTGLLWERLPAALRRQTDRDLLMDAALLHDIGKLAIPGDILRKRGPLTEGEWREIKTHPRRGAELLRGTCFEAAGEWVLYHHERMDGRGYLGLGGERIPLPAQLIAVADTYSALTSGRLYVPVRSHPQAARVLWEAAGTQLNAQWVACFLSIAEDRLREAHRQAFQDLETCRGTPDPSPVLLAGGVHVRREGA